LDGASEHERFGVLEYGQLVDEWDGMPGYVAVDTAVFEDLGDGRMKLVTTSLFHTTEERDGMLESGMEDGLNESYAALDKLLATPG
jgi:uncharacterized protein YndB with AHSA1/START domain